jgi:hypothetical protein
MYASLLNVVLLHEIPASSFKSTKPAYQPSNFDWREPDSLIEQHRASTNGALCFS